MAFRRRRFRRRFGKRRRRLVSYVNRRSFVIPTRGRLFLGNRMTHKFKRTCTITDSATTTALSATSGANFSYNASADSWVLDSNAAALNATYYSMGLQFNLGMLPDYTDFYNLYDQYRISAIKLKLTPYSTNANLQSGLSGSTNQGLAVICHHLVDPDDGAAFTASQVGVNGMRQYPTYKTRNLFNSTGISIKRYFKPRIAMAAFDSAIGTSAVARVNSPPRFLDMVNYAINHFGWKIIFEMFQPDTSQRIFVWFKLEATLYLKMRTPR